MRKITLIKHIDDKNEFDTAKVRVDSISDNLHGILDDMESFLKGCGYFIGINQKISIVDVTEIDQTISVLKRMIDRGNSFLPIYLKSENFVEKKLAQLLIEFLKKQNQDQKSAK